MCSWVNSRKCHVLALREKLSRLEVNIVNKKKLFIINISILLTLLYFWIGGTDWKAIAMAAVLAFVTANVVIKFGRSK